MQTIFELKEQAVTETPLLVFDCALADGRVEALEHASGDGGRSVYEARVLQHNVFEMQTASDQGVDGIPRISIVLANADSHCSEIERATGWKGARLTVVPVLRSAAGPTGSETSGAVPGNLQPAGRDREATFRITASNRMNLQRLLLPQVADPAAVPVGVSGNEEQRMEAVDGGASGKYSRYYRCGYSAGVAGGMGSLDGGAPFSLRLHADDCEAGGCSAVWGHRVCAAGDFRADVRRQDVPHVGGLR